MTFGHVSTCCCDDNCWRRFDVCACSPPGVPVTIYVPCVTIPVEPVPANAVRLFPIGEEVACYSYAGTVDVLPVPAVVIDNPGQQTYDNCEACCDDLPEGCWKLADPCPTCPNAVPAPGDIYVPCDEVTAPVVFKYGDNCYSVTPASSEVTQTPLPPDQVVTPADLYPDCPSCCDSLPPDCEMCQCPQPCIDYCNDQCVSGLGCAIIPPDMTFQDCPSGIASLSGCGPSQDPGQSCCGDSATSWEQVVPLSCCSTQQPNLCLSIGNIDCVPEGQSFTSPLGQISLDGPSHVMILGFRACNGFDAYAIYEKAGDAICAFGTYNYVGFESFLSCQDCQVISSGPAQVVCAA